MNNFFVCDNKPALKFKFKIADASSIILRNKGNRIEAIIFRVPTCAYIVCQY